jgi:hypothetical protein
MKICTLTRTQLRIYKLNAPVLVYSDTDDAVMVDGNPRIATAEEVVALLKSNKKKKLFSIEVDGKPCHFVRGREFLARTLARAHKAAVQLRAPTGRMLMNYRPRNAAHDLLASRVTPVEDARIVEPALLASVAGVVLPVAETYAIVPEPAGCPECAEFLKPLGCRQDEHHFYCKFHDAYEKIRAKRLEAGKTLAAPPLESEPEAPGAEAPELPAKDLRAAMIIDLETGESLRSATPEEVEEATATAESEGFPVIERGGVKYGVATENMTTAGS